MARHLLAATDITRDPLAVGRNPRVIAASQVDWRGVASGKKTLRLRQLPGGGNVMGVSGGFAVRSSRYARCGSVPFWAKVASRITSTKGFPEAGPRKVSSARPHFSHWALGASTGPLGPPSTTAGGAGGGDAELPRLAPGTLEPVRPVGGDAPLEGPLAAQQQGHGNTYRHHDGVAWSASGQVCSTTLEAWTGRSVAPAPSVRVRPRER